MRYPVSQLSAGQVGYVVMGMKSPSEAHVGDTLLDLSQPADALPGFQPSKPMVRRGGGTEVVGRRRRRWRGVCVWGGGGWLGSINYPGGGPLVLKFEEGK